MDTGLDFLAVVEHRLIPAWVRSEHRLIPGRVRSEWSRLRRSLGSIWAPACQFSSHVGNACVGVISLRVPPFPFPPFLLLN